MSWRITPSFTQWSPSLITTSLWLDASDANTVSTVSNNVSQWNDKSGNGRNATQPTAGARPAYTANALNGKAVVAFNGSSQAIELSSLNWTANVPSISLHVVAVPQAVSTSGYPSIFDANTPISGTDRFATYVRSSSFETGGRRLDADSFQSFNTGTVSNGTAFIGSVVCNHSAASLGIAINGSSLSYRTGGFQTAGNTSNTNSSAIVLGASTTSSFSGTYANYFNGSIAEIIITTAVLDLSINERLEGYLAHKWGLTGSLPSGHPYKVNPPAP